jgi:magnesium chelatase family protein
VDVASGLPAFTTVGLPDSAVRESRERVRTAIRNSGFGVLSDRITVNLAPADIRKEGASFDLPIALVVLAATGALDGQIQPVRGVLAVGLACRRRGVGTLLVPSANRREAELVGGLTVLAADTLREAVGLLNGEAPAPRPAPPAPSEHVPEELRFHRRARPSPRQARA